MALNFFKKFRKNRFIESKQQQNDDPFSVKEGSFHFGQLKDSFYYTDWTEGSFLADTSHKEMVTRSFDFGQLKYFGAVAVLALALLLGRAFWLQVTKNNYYSSLSENNRLRAEIIEPKRGIIYSANLQPLVRNKANFVLYFKPIDLPSNELMRDDLLRQISQIVGEGNVATVSPATTNNATQTLAAGRISVASDNAIFYQLKDTLAKIKMGSLESYQPLFVADNIDYDKAMLLALKMPDWPGVFLSSKIRREYILPSATSSPDVLGESSFSHILGYTGKIAVDELQALGPDYSSIDYVGKTGLEASWEKELRGTPGRKNIEVDALGRQKQIVSQISAVDGDNLELSLDSALQQKIEEITQSYIQKAKLHQAAVIMMNANTGEILAMVSLPAYNNNLFAGGISQTDYSKFLNDPSQPLFDRAVSGEFPSGSTIKPIFAAGALQSKIITEFTTVMSTGGLHIGQWFFPDWKVGGHGLTDVKKALALSVNTFFYYIGGGYQDFKGLGVDGLAKYARLFGLGSLTGIDLPGERPGFVPTAAWKLATKKEAWYVGDTYHFAIGQGDVLVTPLQVANYTAAIANGGTLYQPHLVSKVLDSNNNVLYNIAPKVLVSHLIDPANLQIVRAGMRQTITAGSARSLNTLPVQVAGKTGTAQWSTVKAPHAWFIGFAPYDKPQIVIEVLVEEGVGGDVIAAPIAKDILNWYFTSDPNYLTITP
jgi:penicillin-binding protein 2